LIENGRSEEAEPILRAALQLAVDQRHDEPAEELRNILADF